MALRTEHAAESFSTYSAILAGISITLSMLSIRRNVAVYEASELIAARSEVLPRTSPSNLYHTNTSHVPVQAAIYARQLINQMSLLACPKPPLVANQ